MSRGDYTLGDLLGESQLGLELLAGGQDALLTPLNGAHAIELEHPAKWLDTGWMMLTMGVRLRNKPQMQRELIAELQELGASCLGFGVGLSFKSVPSALLDEARRRNFPVVLVPEETQFRDITRAVFHSTVGIESATFQRLSSIQQNLIRAFADVNPLQSIVQRLGRLVHSTVAVMSLDGEVDVATGTIPVTEIAAGLSGQSNFPLAQFDIAEWRILAAPVSTCNGPSGRWLVVATRRTAVAQELARAAVQVTAPLVDAILRLSITNQGQDQAIRQSLLDSALDDSPESLDLRTLGARITALGVDFETDFRAVVLRERPHSLDPGRETGASEELASWLRSRLESLGARYLLSPRSTEIVMVVSSGSVRALSEELARAWPLCVLGVGRPIGSALGIRTSHRDAQIAVRHHTAQSDGAVMWFDDLDVVTQLLAEVPKERLAATAAPIVALLAENPIQFEALRAYFAMNRDVKAAADSIFLHPNTLRYRLERLEQSLGRSLREPSVTASLYCVLTLMPDLLPVRTDAPAGEWAPGERPAVGAPPPAEGTLRAS
ncbi:PucR family transcriptional regulator [Streptomyces plumbiresistens]|uniref:PucR family transcriptional regulator n=1 Tax=Streptomyces plumbiresistens TaxID=511811 RepID=A0ABP7SLF9_9ACTN